MTKTKTNTKAGASHIFPSVVSNKLNLNKEVTMMTVKNYIEDKALVSDREQVLTHSTMWETFHERAYEQTIEEMQDFRAYSEFGILSLVNTDLTDEKPEGIKVQTTKQRKSAKPLFYVEDYKADADLIKQYEKAGYLNASTVAKSRELKTSEFLSKATFHRNMSTNIIIFVVSKFYKNTWKAIFNGIINNKAIMVRVGTKTFRNIKFGSDDFNTLSQMFASVQKESLIAYIRQSNIENKAIRVNQVQSRNVTVERAIVADILADLWELESPQDLGDYQVLLETIQCYLKAEIPATREIALTTRMFDKETKEWLETEDEYAMRKSSGDLTLEKITKLPIELQEQLIPLVSFTFAPVDFYGNEAMLDGDYYEEESY